MTSIYQLGVTYASLDLYELPRRVSGSGFPPMVSIVSHHTIPLKGVGWKAKQPRGRLSRGESPDTKVIPRLQKPRDGYKMRGYGRLL
jgi:hypothetical protein